MSYFDIKKDIRVEKAGGFFCEACLVCKPVSEQSPDGRYCKGCFEVLKEEAEMLSSRTKSAWIPCCGREVSKTVLTHTKVTRVITLPRVGGRPQKIIPIKLIQKLAKDGLSIREINDELKVRGTTISPSTISRALSGQQSKEVIGV